MTITARLLQRLSPFSHADEIDWEQVYAEQMPRIYNYFRYRVADGHAAEDLTSITFEKAWRARAHYQRERAAFTTWLYTIARNVATDHLRHQRVELSLEDVRMQAAAHTPDEQFEQQESFARLSRLMAELSERERELLALKYGAELSHREIARLTGLSESNVGTVVQRATTRLRERWDAHL